MDNLSNFRDQLEPGVMGETDPEGQKMLEMMAHLAAGYGLAKTGGDAGEALYKMIASKLAPTSIEAVHSLAGLTPEEIATVKGIPLSQQPEQFAGDLRSMWVDTARQSTVPDSLEDITRQMNYLNPNNVKPAAQGFGLNAANPEGFSLLQSLKDRFRAK